MKIAIPIKYTESTKQCSRNEFFLNYRKRAITADPQKLHRNQNIRIEIERSQSDSDDDFSTRESKRLVSQPP